MPFLITTPTDMRAAGVSQLDIIIVSGDAYVDHPSFAAAMIGRALQAEGYTVGILAQPNWHTIDDFRKLGQPRLFFGISAGNVDSMLAHYTVARKLRHDDAYSPGGRFGQRPNRASIVYANRLREAWPGTPIILGGIEASLRRLAHYDFWQDKVRRSILLDARADLLVYGMGESQIIEIARRLDAGESIGTLTDIRGTAYETSPDATPTEGVVTAPSAEECAADPAKFTEAFNIAWSARDPFREVTVIQPHGPRVVVQNPPAMPLTTQELDRLYELPFERRWHPHYDKRGGVPALETVRFSVVSHRGCYGNCSFCALSFHQGTIIQSRSEASIVREITHLTHSPEWRGIISDIGGPTANMYKTGCKNGPKGCEKRDCLGSKPCSRLNAQPDGLIRMLRKVRAIPSVRKIFTGSGVRFDLCLLDDHDRYLTELCENHISGQLKIAPEHISPKVLEAMNKTGPAAFEEFVRRFERVNRRLGKRQFLVSYFMSSHPGCDIHDMRDLERYLRRNKMAPEQVQDFYPCPMTASTCMYYTGRNPFTGEPVHVVRSDRDKLAQRHMLNTPGARARRKK